MEEEELSAQVAFLPPMVTFAQNFEDVLLRRALQDIATGFYIDLGAFDPVEDSVTAWFYSQGWRGVNVEPNPDFFARLEAGRPEDVNLPLAVSEGPGTLTLHLMDGLSSAVEEIVEAHARKGRDTGRTIDVETIGLEAIMTERAGDRVVDFLKIDIEGLEGPVLNACRFDTVRPRIIVVEANLPDSTEPAVQSWQGGLLEKGYRLAWSDGLNRYYVRDEDAWRAEIIAVPPNVFDNYRIRVQDRRVAVLGEGGPNGPFRTFNEVVGERNAHARRLESENVRLVDENRSLKDSLDGEKARSERLASELAGVRQELETQKEALNARNADAGRMERDNLRLAEENRSLSGSLDSANERTAAFAAELEDVRRQLQTCREAAAGLALRGAANPESDVDGGRDDGLSSARRQAAFERLRRKKSSLLEAFSVPTTEDAVPAPAEAAPVVQPVRRTFRENLARARKRWGRSISKRVKRFFPKT